MMNKNLDNLRLVNFVKQETLVNLKTFLEKNDFLIYEINGSKINSAETFFQTILGILPLDPPLSGQVHWDAFTDSFWNGISELGSGKVALIWTHTENMLISGLSDLVVAIECFKDISIGLMNDIPPIRFFIFFVGTGNNFKELPSLTSTEVK